MKPFRIVCASFVMFSSSALLFAQTPANRVQTQAKPAFEVASIRASAPVPTLMAQIQSGTVRPGISVSGNRFDCLMSLDSLIATAYRIKNPQIVGPNWLNSQRFEIHATIPEGASKDQVPEMLQTLLEERFELKASLENKEEAVYALVVSKEGSKLMNADDVSAFYGGAPNTADLGLPFFAGREVIIDLRTGVVSRGSSSDGMRRIEILNSSMSALADRLTQFVDRPIVDATGLKGSYKVTMVLPMEVIQNARAKERARSDGTPAGTASDLSGGAVFKAVEEMGLKLDPRRAPIEKLIIEHIEKNPTEN